MVTQFTKDELETDIKTGDEFISTLAHFNTTSQHPWRMTVILTEKYFKQEKFLTNDDQNWVTLGHFNNDQDELVIMMKSEKTELNQPFKQIYEFYDLKKNIVHKISNDPTDPEWKKSTPIMHADITTEEIDLIRQQFKKEFKDPLPEFEIAETRYHL